MARISSLICAIQWFIIDLRGIGWVFYAVGATLYLGSALLYLVRGDRHPAPYARRVGGAGRAGLAPDPVSFRTFQVRFRQVPTITRRPRRGGPADVEGR